MEKRKPGVVGGGRLSTIIRGSQANFDHLMGVIRELVNAHNASVDDLEDIKNWVEGTLDSDSIHDIVTRAMDAGPSGVSGPPGLDGSDGSEGPSGPVGAVGPTGATGATGATGSQGAAGSLGTPGLDGEDGTDGLPGMPGTPGADGATGPQGAPGAVTPGSPGLDGEDGLDGWPGPQGPTGSAGATGDQGAPGISTQGLAGSDGEDGVDGFPGPPGPAGATGATGADGSSAPGSPGPPGMDGEDGDGAAMPFTHEHLVLGGVDVSLGAYISRKISGDRSFIDGDFFGGRSDLGFWDGWLGFNASGAGATVGPTAGTAEAAHPGVANLTTGTTAAGISAVGNSFQSAAAFAGSSMWTPGAGRLRCGWVIKTPSALSDGTDRYRLRMGFGNGSFAETSPANGAFFEYKDTINGGKWQLVTDKASAESVADSGVTVVASTWYYLEVEINAAGTSVDYYINHLLVGTIATNVPTVNLSTNAGIAKSVGTTARIFNADYAFVLMVMTTAR